MAKYIHGDSGDHIEELQRKIQGLGVPLPKFGADGSFGNETFTAIECIADEELEEGISIPQDIIDDILASASGADVILPGIPENVNFKNVTTHHSGVHRKGARPYRQIDAIVLHQTGCLMPKRAAAWTTLRAHIGIPRTEPQVVLVNPLNSYMWHANGFNRRSVGIEISGNFAGIEGNHKTWWQKGGGEKYTVQEEVKVMGENGEPDRMEPVTRELTRPYSVTEDQIAATKECIRWIVSEIARNGGEIKHIFAHRQSSSQRIGDPGSKVWREIGLWAKEELGLSDGGADFVSGKGYVIPADWTDEELYKGNRYFR